jgi:multisubunit Na+/H+ antiporter MnhG subunit
VKPLVVATTCAVLGLLSVIVGCALISPALALVVGGAGLLAFALLIDTPGRKKRGA